MARRRLLGRKATTLSPGDGLLLGVDLVKDPDVLVPAYDDAKGVTAVFNRNILEVINRELAGDLPVEVFSHRAIWDAEAERIEMHLVAGRQVHAELASIDLPVAFERGEHIVTEHCWKFRVDRLIDELATVDFEAAEVETDSLDRFALILAVPTSEASG